MPRRINFKQQLLQNDQVVDCYTDLVTYIASEVFDDVGINDTVLVIPGSTAAYTAYTLNLNDSALATYFIDVSNDTDEGALIKFNGDATVFKIWPDLWLEESIDTILAKNDSTTKRVIRVIQFYPRTLTV